MFKLQYGGGPRIHQITDYKPKNDRKYKCYVDIKNRSSSLTCLLFHCRHFTLSFFEGFHHKVLCLFAGMAKQLIMVPRRSPATSPPYPGHTFVPLPVTPSEDNYSSEEELKEIINEQNVKEKSKKSPSKKDKSKNPSSLKNGLGSLEKVPVASNAASASVASATVAEKRKWSEVISDDDLADLEDDDAGLELELTMQRSSRLYVRSSGGASTTTASMSSSCSNDDADSGCLCGRRSKLTTPVQFCTSPPMDVHR